SVSETCRYYILWRHQSHCRDIEEGRKLAVGGAKPLACVEVIMTELLLRLCRQQQYRLIKGQMSFVRAYTGSRKLVLNSAAAALFRTFLVPNSAAAAQFRTKQW